MKASLDFWLVWGFIGQFMFSLRFIVQWIESERQKRSVIPISFWYFSLLGTIMLAIYAFKRNDPVFFIGQIAGLFIYLRNLILIYHSNSSRFSNKKDA